MERITIWHNPRCSKSREAISILEKNNCETNIFKYLDEKPSITEIKKVLELLGFQSARELMRTKEEIYKELLLRDEEDEEKLIEAMAMHHKLIERPILIKNNRAIIGRPTSIIADFIRS